MERRMALHHTAEARTRTVWLSKEGLGGELTPGSAQATLITVGWPGGAGVGAGAATGAGAGAGAGTGVGAGAACWPDSLPPP